MGKDRKIMRKTKLAGIILLSMLLMAGCGGDFPDLSDEQVEKAGEYAAMTLLKYDSQNRKRLMTLEDMAAEEQRREMWKQAARQGAKEADKEEQASSEQTQNSSTQGSQEGQEETTPGALSDGFVLPDGVKIEYLGHILCDVYPQDSSDFFAIVASEGRKNLVLRFWLANESDGSQSLDMVEQNNVYRITVNGNYSRASLPTFLDNDLANYQGKLMPGAGVELVLLIEVESDTQISSLRMKLKNDRIESTILLEP